MKITDYHQLQEKLYTKVLKNGLRVSILPKKDFHKTYGLFTTQYGSIDNQFIPLGANEKVCVPDGIAHFLEHKMFEKESGDAFQLFGQYGASANAFTSFTQTSYLFSTTDYIDENMTTLLDFVQDPYFTKESVNKEKGIIGQEIQMYQDEPNWRLFFGLLQNLYPKHPLHIDIAGTIESIDQITAEDLYMCYHTFYHPSNMNLFVVGNVNPETMMHLIEKNQNGKQFASPNPIVRYFPEETTKDILASICPYSEFQMSIARTKCIVGIRGVDTVPINPVENTRYRLSLKLLFQLLFGKQSANFKEMYEKGIIDDSFGYEVNIDRGFHFADISSDTDQPKVLSKYITTILSDVENSSELTDENLDLLKKKMIGKWLQSLNSLEYIANQFSKLGPNDLTLFDSLPILESIKMEDIVLVAKNFIHPDAMSTCVISPLTDAHSL